jgi:hypothetical protein
METPLLEALLSQSFWTFAGLAAVAICSCITWINVARHKHRPERIRAEAELLKTRLEEARRDRALDAQIEFVTQLAHGMKQEADGHLPTLSAPKPARKSVSNRIEAKAA